MKKTFTLLLALMMLGSSFTLDCEDYFIFREGSTYEYTQINAKGKIDRINTYHVDDLNKASGDVEAHVSYVSKNDKGKDEMSGDFTVICREGNYYIDAKNLVSEDQTRQYKDFKMVVTQQQNLEYPKDMIVGQVLKNAKINIDINTKEGGLFGNMECLVSERKVLKKDTVNTPVGQFMALQISNTIESRVKVAGIGIPVNLKTVEYFVPKFGIVKTLTYNKSGDKLKGTQVLSRYNK